MPLTPCLACGRLSKGGSYCASHEPKAWKVRPSPSSRDRPSPRLRERIKRRDSYRCQRCGTSGSAENLLRIHHRRWVARGGGHDDFNLLTLCSDCHDAEHRMRH